MIFPWGGGGGGGGGAHEMKNSPTGILLFAQIEPRITYLIPRKSWKENEIGVLKFLYENISRAPEKIKLIETPPYLVRLVDVGVIRVPSLGRFAH